ncbi:hypothetical protein CLOSAC_29090 [Clostridium saccharobutylicum]|uniref:Uncharacterized protein n=2 Tax=Clostridium saccharobutylicum TaxID=169679 RepID=A0A1S8N4A4_CLOSA|nr:hypothetical protein CLOSAC_29090 [Clostridium saccharobutylicum]
MVENYNSFDYWEKVIDANKTIRGHIFMQELPTENSIYFHTLIFSKKTGINSIWGYFPNVRSLLGYIQYSFLQEAFYKWIYGRERLVTKIPYVTVEKIISEGERKNKISKDTAASMRYEYRFLNHLWNMPSKKVEIELKKFISAFNKRWIGDKNGFLYIKVFKTPEELGDLVISSSLITSTEEELQNKIGMTIDEWKDVCSKAIKDTNNGEIFRNILFKKLSEVF